MERYDATKAKGGLVDPKILAELLRERGIDQAMVDPTMLETILKKLATAPKPLGKSDFKLVK